MEAREAAVFSTTSAKIWSAEAPIALMMAMSFSKRGMTQEKTAEKLGIRRVRYVYMETGRALPTIPILVRIAALYGISTDALLGVERASEEKKPRGSA